MPELNFQIEGAAPIPFAAAPTLGFQLQIGSVPEQTEIYSVALRCQIQIETTRRTYLSHEQAALKDLFGEPERWGQTLRNLLWAQSSMVISPFTGTTNVDLHIPCTFDFSVAATKYFHGVSEGDLPLLFLFSGIIFYSAPNGALQISPISWEKEARYRLPVAVWRDLMNAFYPDTAWLYLRRDVFEQLYQYKIRSGIPTWDQTVQRVLAAAEARVEQ